MLLPPLTPYTYTYYLYVLLIRYIYTYYIYFILTCNTYIFYLHLKCRLFLKTLYNFSTKFFCKIFFAKNTRPDSLQNIYSAPTPKILYKKRAKINWLINIKYF